MALPVWSYLIADLRGGAILDEIPLEGVTWDKKLNGSGTLSGTWTLTPQNRRDARRLTTPAQRVVYALSDGKPLWGGIIWTSSYDSSSAQLRIGAADFWSYFDRRFVLPVLAGSTSDTHYIAPLSTTYTATEQNAIAAGLLALAQSHTGGDIGVSVSAAVSTSLRDRTYDGWSLVSTGDALRNLSRVLGGPDFLFDVASGSSERPQRRLLVGNPDLGNAASPHVWEHGGNCSSYTWDVDGSAMATRRYAYGAGQEQAAPIAWAENAAVYSDAWPLLEDVRQYSTVSTDGTLIGHVQADMLVGRLPVELPKLVVRGSASPMLGEFSLGDWVTFAVPAGDLYFPSGTQARVRLLAMDVAPADDKVTLTVTPA